VPQPLNLTLEARLPDMPFTKRKLTEIEISKFNFESFGISGERVPPQTWDWAVDSDRDIYFTQLISNSHEMRDGYYWYLLVMHQAPYIFKLTEGRSIIIDGVRHASAKLENLVIDSLELPKVEQAASDAHKVISVHHESLYFAAHTQSAMSSN
jgi:hypothetical protein